MRQINCKLRVEVEFVSEDSDRELILDALKGVGKTRKVGLNEYSSSGLDLAISKELAESLHGSIDGKLKGRRACMFTLRLATVLKGLTSELPSVPLGSTEEGVLFPSLADVPLPRRGGGGQVLGKKRKGDEREPDGKRRERELEREIEIETRDMKMLDFVGVVGDAVREKPPAIEGLFLPEDRRFASSASSLPALQKGGNLEESLAGAAVEFDRSSSQGVPHILIVEDNALNQKILQKYLGKLGVDFTAAWDGYEAVELFLERFRTPTAFDFVFMDIRMPRMDGVEATLKIRELEKRLHLDEGEESQKRSM